MARRYDREPVVPYCLARLRQYVPYLGGALVFLMGLPVLLGTSFRLRNRRELRGL